MEKTRHYEDDETPEIGDVVELFDGPFSTGFVVELPRDPNGEAIVTRIHASMSNGDFQIEIEQRRLTLADLRKLPVFLNGQFRIDNRA